MPNALNWNTAASVPIRLNVRLSKVQQDSLHDVQKTVEIDLQGLKEFPFVKGE